MLKGHAATIYKTPRMPCAAVCNNHSTRYILKKHCWCDGQKIPNKSTFVHQMHHTQSVETLQRYLILVNLSSRVQKEISAPPRVSDTEVTLLVQHSCWKTLQTYLHATHVMNDWATHILCDQIRFRSTGACLIWGVTFTYRSSARCLISSLLRANCSSSRSKLKINQH